jgi:hypothetical protein
VSRIFNQRREISRAHRSDDAKPIVDETISGVKGSRPETAAA